MQTICNNVGEMEIPMKNGMVSEDNIGGEIGQVLEGKLPGRLSEEEITIFDATGIALLDLVTAKIAIDQAEENGVGQFVEI